MPGDNDYKKCEQHFSHTIQLAELKEDFKEIRNMIGKVYGKINELQVASYRLMQVETDLATHTEQIQEIRKSIAIMERLDQDVRLVLKKECDLESRVTELYGLPLTVTINDVGTLKEDVEKLKQAPATLSHKIIMAVLTVVGLAVLGLVLAKFGLKV